MPPAANHRRHKTDLVSVLLIADLKILILNLRPINLRSRRIDVTADADGCCAPG
jgi:hypothetical protein